ncbi:hypothetical protein BDV36DRAFT_248988 [Aspergillus pseudocaelatus]|uniref:Secreted protein n=1 Tax=Aspergillus pseudocaelatus TaxID=1825620 RepID=A0ABQ6WUD1_9EURO|nr:hypothetical protein BDV36DRAFT_248988 [Aspergillus pseudocaelatus]
MRSSVVHAMSSMALALWCGTLSGPRGWVFGAWDAVRTACAFLFSVRDPIFLFSLFCPAKVRSRELMIC